MLRRMTDSKRTTIVITGASRGLGAGMAQALAADHNLGLCARGAISLDIPDAVTARADVTDEQAMAAFEAAVTERFGTIDLWINNAGVLGPIAQTRDQSADGFEQVLAVNVLGVFLGSRTYVRHLRRRESRGVLINISSGAARRPYPGWSAYCASKAAVDMFTRALALEEADHLRALSVAPGVIDTDMQAAIRACSPDDFPPVQRFLDLKRDDAFFTADHVARELVAMAFDPARADGEVVCRVQPPVS